MNNIKNRVLMIGIGNNARADDGLGWKFLEKVKSGLKSVDIEYRYQLQIEDAALVHTYDTLILVDASETKLENGFSFTQCRPAADENSFTSHRLTASGMLWLSRELYAIGPRTSLLAIEGRHWELGEGLSDQAEVTLSKAVVFFNKWFTENSIENLHHRTSAGTEF
jgi:hydrogenase maturation protease